MTRGNGILGSWQKLILELVSLDTRAACADPGRKGAYVGIWKAIIVQSGSLAVEPYLTLPNRSIPPRALARAAAIIPGPYRDAPMSTL